MNPLSEFWELIKSRVTYRTKMLLISTFGLISCFEIIRKIPIFEVLNNIWAERIGWILILFIALIVMIVFFINDLKSAISIKRIKLEQERQAIEKEKQDFIGLIQGIKDVIDLLYKNIYHSDNLSDLEKVTLLSVKSEDEINKIYGQLHGELRRIAPGSLKYFNYTVPTLDENRYDEIMRKFYSGEDGLTSNKVYDVKDSVNRIIYLEKELNKIIVMKFY